MGSGDNQVARHFGCKPPTLVDYLGGVSDQDGDVIVEDTALDIE